MQHAAIPACNNCRLSNVFENIHEAKVLQPMTALKVKLIFDKMSLSMLLDSDGEMLIEIRRNERSLWDVTLPHYSNVRLARFLFLLLNAKCYQ